MLVDKDRVRCVIVASGWRIEGDLHVLAGSRLTDSLNVKGKEFVAVTNSVIHDMSSGEQLFEVPYMAVNRDAVAMIFPAE